MERNNMDSEIGYYLQELRTKRRMSTSQLARRAGIGRATLHRWQAGKGQPRLQELEAVLKEMAVSPVERISALTLLASSIKRFRKEVRGAHVDYADLLGPQPHCGDLLRALRLRNEQTRADVAQFAGIAQATVARWERAEVWPEQARLQRVAQILNVREAEFEALARGPLLTNDPSPCLECLREQWEECRQGPYPSMKAAHADLMLLKLAAQAWVPACHGSGALKLLADIYTLYTEHLYFQRRFPECEQMALRARNIYIALDNETDPFWARAVLRGSSALARKGSRRAIERAMRQLRSHFPCNVAATYQAWMLSELGKMAALHGDAVEALRLGSEAVSLAQSCGDLPGLALRQEDMARIYLRTGHPQEALNTTPPPVAHPYSRFVHAEAYLMLGRPEEARLALRSASEWIDAQQSVASHETPFYRAELQTLLAKL